MKIMTVTRDEFAGVLFSEQFFAENPAFAHLQEQVMGCKTAYEENKKSSSCRCGGKPSLLFPCIDAVLDFVESVRATQPEVLQGVARYVAKMRGRTDSQSFTLYYRKTGSEPLRKVRFP
jgi:hypothetical protein